MIVWIVEGADPNEPVPLDSVWSTKDQAERRVDRLHEANPYQVWEINEYPVDEEPQHDTGPPPHVVV